MATVPSYLSALGVGCGACDMHLCATPDENGRPIPQYIEVPCLWHRPREWKVFSAIQNLSKSLMPADRDKRINFVNKCWGVYRLIRVGGEPAAIQRLTDIVHKEGFTINRYDAMKIATDVFNNSGATLDGT